MNVIRLLGLDATEITGTMLLIVAIAYKLFIGSIRKTSKYGELYRSGAKSTGVFSVLAALKPLDLPPR